MEQEQPRVFAIDWCQDVGLTDAVAAFFVAHAHRSYISHSELQFGRATAPDRWSEDLRGRIAADARRAILNGGAAGPWAGPRLVLARSDEAIAGITFVTLHPDAATPFAVLEDLLVAPAAQGQGLGRTLLDWVVRECRAHGFRRLFLESGLANHRAHDFFARQGFTQTSIVMMRDL